MIYRKIKVLKQKIKKIKYYNNIIKRYNIKINKFHKVHLKFKMRLLVLKKKNQ